MSEHRVELQFRSCPRDPEHHHQARVVTEVINDTTIITKSCNACGQFISETRLPVARRSQQ